MKELQIKKPSKITKPVELITSLLKYGKLEYVKDYLFSTFAKCSKQLTFLAPLIRTRMFAYQGVRNVSFQKILRTYYINDP